MNNEISVYKIGKVGLDAWYDMWDSERGGGASKKDGMWFKGELVKGWKHESVDEMVKGCNGERVK